jgi:hypothetical protein
MSIPSMQQTPARTRKPPISERLKALLAEWGPLLLVVWFGLFAIVLVGFVVAIEFGFKVESTAGALGTWGAAYVATQLTKPLRFAATLVITPALGTFLKRFRRKETPNAGAEPPAAELPTRELP